MPPARSSRFAPGELSARASISRANGAGADKPLLSLPRPAEFGFLSKSAKHPAARAQSTASSADATSPEIALDGTLGPSGPLSAANGTYTITSDMGQIRGPNLFQSFSQFNLSAGETASFTGPSSIQNVLVRVTGGGPSNVNGALRCTIPNADFYLINPAGVIFGANSSLALQGGFCVTTADYVKLADSGVFSASSPGSSSLTAAIPATFNFVSSAPAPMTVQNTTITPVAGKFLIALVGDLTVDGGELASAGDGAAIIASIRSPGNAKIQLSNSSQPIDLSSFANLGTINLRNDGVLGSDARSSSSGSGSVFVMASTIFVTGNSLPLNAPSSFLGSFSGFDFSTGLDFPAGSTTVSATGAISISGGGFVGSGGNGTQSGQSLSGAGTSGAVSITAGSLSVDGSSLVSAASRSTGNLAVHASGQINVLEGGVIGTSSQTGHSGTVSIYAASVTVNGVSSPFSSQSEVISQGIISDNVTINASGPVSVHGGGFVGSSGGSQAGSVNITASSLSIGGRGPAKSLGLSSGEGPPSEIGNSTEGSAGNVSITLGASGVVQMMSGGLISSDASGGINSGSILIKASSLVMQGNDCEVLTQAGEQAGQVTINSTGLVSIGSGATIQSMGTKDINGGTGTPGQIAIGAAQITFDGSGSVTPTGILISGPLGSDSGMAPDISFVASGAMVIKAGATIAANSFGSQRAGIIHLNAGELVIDSGSIISQSYDGGTGGIIDIDAGALQMSGGTIAANNFRGATTAGLVDVTVAGNAVLDASSSISATSGGGLARPLSVTLTTEIEARTDSVILISPKGTEVPLGQLYPNSTGKFSDAGSNGATVPVGFLSNYVANDLNGAWSLQLRAPPGDTEPGRAIDNWSLSLGGQVIGTSTTRVTGNSPISTLIVTGANPGLTGGPGGDINLAATTLHVLGRSSISSATMGTGPAGKVNIRAGTILVSNGGRIDSATVPPAGASMATGSAGSVFIKASDTVMIDRGGFIGTSSPWAAGGDVTVDAGENILMRGGTMSAQALSSGGSLDLHASNTIDLLGAKLVTRAGGDGGDITIDPDQIVLQGSRIDARSTSAKGGNVTINPTALVQASTTITATGKKGASGKVTLAPPDAELAGALAPLTTGLSRTNLQLAPVCAPSLGGNFSSFVVTGQGGRPPEPGGWMPDLILQGDGGDDRKP